MTDKERIENPSRRYFYMLVDKNENPIVTDSRVPIYWIRGIAEKNAIIHNCRVAKVEVYKIAITTPIKSN